MAAMEQQTAMWIKQEETDVAHSEPGSIFLQDPLKLEEYSLHVKEDVEWKLDVNSSEQKFLQDPLKLEVCSLHVKEDVELKLDVNSSEQKFFEDPLNVGDAGFHIKQDPELDLDVDGSVRNFYEEPLNIGDTGFHIKQDPELDLDVDGSEHNVHIYPSTFKVKEELEEAGNQEFLEDSFGMAYCTDGINEEPELHLGWDETESNISVNALLDALLEAENECCPPPLLMPKTEPVIPSTRFAPVSRRSIQICAETCGTTYEETVRQGVVHDLMKIDTEKSRNVSTSSAHKCGLITILSNSLKGKEIQKFNCSCCLQSFTSKYRLMQHVFMHIEGVQPPKNVCKLCGEVFPSNHGVKQHLKMHKCDALSSENKCNVSDKAIAHLLSSTLPSLIDSGEKVHQCDAYVKPLTEFDNHKKLEIIHSVGICQKHICGKSLNQFSNVKSRPLTHTGKTLHKCHICGKSFSQCRDLKRHNLIHTGVKPHKCNICSKSFTQMVQLKNHQLIHTGSTPHKCDICGKSFTLIGNLKRHHLIHTGAKPHKCDFCDKSFTQVSNLKKHHLIHTGIKPHKCDICGKSFTQLNNLKRHSLLHV